jgi:osmotically-inducible protein OsmY
MNRHTLFLKLASALLLAVLLSACATNQKCDTKSCSGDAEITEQVRTSLGQHSALMSTMNIGVQTINHVVYLTGLVDTGQERSIAESVAKETPGVTRVVNSISVRNRR